MASPHDRIFQRILEEITLDIEGFELVPKHESRFMKLLNVFVGLFNKSFMTRYTTTIAPVVYAPKARLRNKWAMWKVLAHEWIHLREARRLTFPVWVARYLLPQILTPLALLSLLAIWFSNLWLLCLLWLLCAAPLPAYFRAKEEMKAYTLNFAITYWVSGSVHEDNIEHIAENFYGSNYYFMWPFKKALLKQMHEEIGKIAAGEYDNVFPHSKVKEIIDHEWKTQVNNRV